MHPACTAATRKVQSLQAAGVSALLTIALREYWVSLQRLVTWLLPAMHQLHGEVVILSASAVATSKTGIINSNTLRSHDYIYQCVEPGTWIGPIARKGAKMSAFCSRVSGPK